MEHFVKNKLFTNKQFGFLKGRSTVTQLLQILDDWTETLESGGRIDVVYTDFEKAFDKVPHNRLLIKLKAYKLHYTITCLYFVSISVSVCLSLCNHQN